MHLPSVKDLISCNPGKFFKIVSRSAWSKSRGARHMLSLEAFPVEPITWWWPVRKCGREKVIDPMPITKMPGNTRNTHVRLYIVFDTGAKIPDFFQWFMCIENNNFHKIHILKFTFLTKFTFSNSHFSQNSHFSNIKYLVIYG